MKTDVQLLIAALTTERNALDRAIAALEMITPEKHAAPPKPARVRQRRYGGHTTIGEETKAAVVRQMLQAPPREKYQRAGQLARDYGLKQKTIASSWVRWQREAEKNGNVTTAPVQAEGIPAHV